MRIVPAIDLIGGKCVRLTQGDYAQKQTYTLYVNYASKKPLALSGRKSGPARSTVLTGPLRSARMSPNDHLPVRTPFADKSI